MKIRIKLWCPDCKCFRQFDWKTAELYECSNCGHQIITSMGEY